MELIDKLTILADSAKYDAACTSSGSERTGKKGIGNTMAVGCCHAFSADGRCISLLKVLMTNACIYDCKYCINRISNDIKRAAFTPKELADLTIEFYRRNYIEGLFLSSGVIKSPDYTMEQMINVIHILRHEHNFWGYVHAKTIPGASPELVYQLGLLADRLSVNIELPSEGSLKSLAPNKTRKAIFKPMSLITQGLAANKQEIVLYKNAPVFASAGHSTQMIVGASPETDFQIVRLAESLYGKYQLRRVFYSAYIPANEDKLLPALHTKPPLLREHRLYQADWLLRNYRFKAKEILNEQTPNFNPYLDPKCNWAVNNMGYFPVDINRDSYSRLLRVPGIGPKSAERIVIARKTGALGLAELKRIGVVLKRAQYFILTKDTPRGMKTTKEMTTRALIDPGVFRHGSEQLSLFDNTGSQTLPAISEQTPVEEAVEEAVLCLAKNL